MQICAARREEETCLDANECCNTWDPQSGKCVFVDDVDSSEDSVCFTCNDEANPITKDLPSARILWDLETLNRAMSKYADHLQQLGPIPQKVYVSWTRKFNIDERNDTLMRFGLHRLKRMNPMWQIIICDDSDIEHDLIRWLEPKDAEMIKPKHIVEKTDLWRLLKMYHEGGMYVDIDRLHNKKLDSVITAGVTKMLLPVFTHRGTFQDFSQDLMCTSPNNAAYKGAADLNLKRHRLYEYCQNKGYEKDPVIQHGLSQHGLSQLGLSPEFKWVSEDTCMDQRMASPRAFVAFAGAISYLEALSEHIFGIGINPDPGECASKRIYELLDSLKPALVTKAEVIPHSTMTYEDSEETLDWNTAEEHNPDDAKKAFYSRERIGSWMVQVPH
jgi:hypothetical protein